MEKRRNCGQKMLITLFLNTVHSVLSHKTCFVVCIWPGFGGGGLFLISGFQRRDRSLDLACIYDPSLVINVCVRVAQDGSHEFRKVPVVAVD